MQQSGEQLNAFAGEDGPLAIPLKVARTALHDKVVEGHQDRAAAFEYASTEPHRHPLL